MNGFFWTTSFVTIVPCAFQRLVAFKPLESNDFVTLSANPTGLYQGFFERLCVSTKPAHRHLSP